eukprot:TRINITY_DN5364_c0_g1_i1.p1 TRINITY_DN5364_c0_g1~~TRINITY_DN5364_c0_g1_i1.p1  ORF type:complete len:459 (+),score=179.22 TRINITY_DN5364_c0_g1_i1:97-1473(+)
MRKTSAGMKAMDLLKNALAERQAKAQKTITESGKKWVRQSELEAKRKEEYFEQARQEEERRKAEEEAHLQKFADHLTKRKSKNEVLNKTREEGALDLADALLEDDNAEPPIGLSEVVDQLRELGYPITLFGETDMQRYKRLRLIQKEEHEGKKNPDILMLEQVNEMQRLALPDGGAGGGEGDKSDDDNDNENKSKSESEAEGSNAGGGGGGGGGAAASDKSDSEDEDAGGGAADDKSDSEDEGGGNGAAADDKSDSEDEGAKIQDDVKISEEPEKKKKEKLELEDDIDFTTDLMDRSDFVRAWVRKALKAWEKELADLPDEDKVTSKVKVQVAAHRQVRRDVRPLQKRLKLYVMKENLLEKIHMIVKYADEREYRLAAEAYIDLSVGKAAWPVGIGCGGSMLMEDAIGLHDKFNRMANVKDNAVTLNDDVTRKFVQALKRLMNVAQRYWPPVDPSKAG